MLTLIAIAFGIYIGHKMTPVLENLLEKYKHIFAKVTAA